MQSWGKMIGKVEQSAFGNFGWIKDGECNRIELWQPPKT
jgi:hypothetical protein